MTRGEQPPPTEAEVEAFAADFRRVLREEHGVELRCPGCGADEWLHFGDVGLSVLQGRDPATGEIEKIAGAVHTLAGTRGKCGLISLFDRDVVGG
jgi:hypothetical protein